MNEKQYRSLCDACDRLLLAPDATIERVALQWLHVIREHPALLEQYANLFDPEVSESAVARRWLWTARRRLGKYRQFIKGIGAYLRPKTGRDGSPGRVDVLFVSHFVSADHAGRDEDFYYGTLPHELSVLGYSVAVALINHTDLPAEAIHAKWAASPVPRFVLRKLLDLSDELRLYRQIRREATRLRGIARGERQTLDGRLLARASAELSAGGADAALRIAYQIGELVAKLKSGTVVVTHEGHAWERVTFAVVRKSFPSVKCIGYQHAALFRLQHALRRSLAPEYNPDHILAAGTASGASLRNSPGLKGIPVTVLGSNRSYSAGKITAGLSADGRLVETGTGPVCLVLPEGVASECHLLFEFSLACAHAFPEVVFVWRAHPLINLDVLVKQNSKLAELPRNVVISKGSLDEDLRRSRWALYRGTTAIIQAVMAGIRPIYLRQPGELTVDPLYALEDWRMTVTNVSDFGRVVSAGTEKHDRVNDEELTAARQHCESIFVPFNVGSLIDVIRNDGNEPKMGAPVAHDGCAGT